MSDVETEDTIVNQSITSPSRKKENVKAWLFTLVLHGILASGLVGYWYFHQRHQSVANNQSKFELETKGSVSPSHSLDSRSPDNVIVPVNTTASATLDNASTTSSSEFYLPPVTFNAPTMYFFELGDAQPNAIETMIATNDASQTPAPAPTAIAKPMAQAQSTKSVLTNRDIAYHDSSNNKANHNYGKPSVGKDIVQPTDDSYGNDNQAEVDRLINQVKTRNKQTIDEAISLSNTTDNTRTSQN